MVRLVMAHQQNLTQAFERNNNLILNRALHSCIKLLMKQDMTHMFLKVKEHLSSTPNMDTHRKFVQKELITVEHKTKMKS